MRMAITGSIIKRISNPIKETMMSKPLFNIPCSAFYRKVRLSSPGNSSRGTIHESGGAAVAHFPTYEENLVSIGGTPWPLDRKNKGTFREYQHLSLSSLWPQGKRISGLSGLAGHKYSFPASQQYPPLAIKLSKERATTDNYLMYLIINIIAAPIRQVNVQLYGHGV
jgi:hypothetical protein